MEKALDLSVEAKLESLQVVRQYIDRSGERIGVNETALGDLRLAVDEAVTNVILHGYEGLDGRIELHMESDGDAVIIRIRDQAKPFDSSLVIEPQLDAALKDRPFGGMGLFLIKKTMDEVEFLRPPDGGNELRLIKRGAIPAKNQT